MTQDEDRPQRVVRRIGQPPYIVTRKSTLVLSLQVYRVQYLMYNILVTVHVQVNTRHVDVRIAQVGLGGTTTRNARTSVSSTCSPIPLVQYVRQRAVCLFVRVQ